MKHKHDDHAVTKKCICYCGNEHEIAEEECDLCYEGNCPHECHSKE